MTSLRGRRVRIPGRRFANKESGGGGGLGVLTSREPHSLTLAQNSLRDWDGPGTNTPSIAFWHLSSFKGCRKPVLGVWLRASLSGTSVPPKDVVNQCLEFDRGTHIEEHTERQSRDTIEEADRHGAR